MKKPNLSQSVLKDYVDYYDPNTNGCGKQLWYRHFEKIATPQSDVQKLGVYFEYLATGYLREGESIPEPQMVYKGTAKEKLAADYEKVHESVLLYNKMIEEHGIEIITKGEYMFHNGCSGISDLRAKFDGEECIIDLKYTSLFDDKFSEYGWHTESLIYKPKLLLQPTHYKYLAKNILGIDDIPFYYFIFHSKDPEKAKIIKVNIDEAHIQLHEQSYVNKMKKYIDFHYENPDKLEARPSYLRCKECAFKDICPNKTSVPLIEEIYY
jgi:CRISPR/Cas system-associated exonuclease Cas4 (RecB family)